MQMSGNTILITGGGTGIGRGLAEAFHRRGNRVILAGRRQEPLEEVTRANPGMQSRQLDVASDASVRSFAESLRQQFPELNAVIHNAGIMRPERVDSGDSSDAEATVAINLLGPIRLNAALLPLLLRQPRATVMTVSSGLAFVPLAMTPTYSASKAAIHSWTQSLRYQLKDSNVQVIELAPPYVQTELLGPQMASDPNAMPLAEFIAEVMHLLETTPKVEEVLVERVKRQRFAEQNGQHEEIFQSYNDMMSYRR